MSDFLTFLSNHSNGICILLIIILSGLITVNWLARIFQWGKYKDKEKSGEGKSGEGKSEKEKESNGFGYIMTQFFTNLISDFKHLLALIIVIVFTTLIIYSMTTTPIFKEKMEALQLVIASLGGLLGSIIGYYFGESAGKNRDLPISNNTEATQSVNNDGMEVAPPIPDKNKKPLQ